MSQLGHRTTDFHYDAAKPPFQKPPRSSRSVYRGTILRPVLQLRPGLVLHTAFLVPTRLQTLRVDAKIARGFMASREHGPVILSNLFAFAVAVVAIWLNMAIVKAVLGIW